MRRMLKMGLLLVAVATAFSSLPGLSYAACEGSSGSATIDGSLWNALCVVAATSQECVDSTGANYECFQIVGTDSVGTYSGVAIFLAGEPVQGQTYQLGGASGNGAMVIGQAGLWITANDPYVGQIEVTVYSPGSGVIECNFSFLAQPLLFGSDLEVANGVFVGKLLPVSRQTWASMKSRYRTR